jgi:hypothetical protein
MLMSQTSAHEGGQQLDHGPKFREDYLDLVTEAAARVFPGGAAQKLERLSFPTRRSPFLTLALRSDRGLRTHVIKVLVVLRTEPSSEAWVHVFEAEHQRLVAALEARQARPQTLSTLRLPLLERSMQNDVDELVPLRHADLLESGGGDGETRFRYFLRPYLPWPKLKETGYRAERMAEIFDQYCARERIRPQDPAERARGLRYFADVALVSGSEIPEEEVFLVSTWRLRTSLQVEE